MSSLYIRFPNIHKFEIAISRVAFVKAIRVTVRPFGSKRKEKVFAALNDIGKRKRNA
jgi:hypothetical protein